MNAWLTWRPDEKLAQVMRGVLRRGTRMSHHLFSIVGGSAILLAVALWLMPTWRGTLAAKLMPVISAAVQAGPARLLQGNPLPSFHKGVFASTELAAVWHLPSVDYSAVPFARGVLPVAPAPPAILRPADGVGTLRDALGPVSIHPAMRKPSCPEAAKRR